MCKCVLYYCHQVATQLQLTNISYHISKNKEGCSAVEFCVYQKIQLFSAVFYAVRAVDKFELTLVINRREKKPCGNRGSRV
jgi:hypothetical protein